MTKELRKLSKELGYYLPNRLTINMGDYELPIQEWEAEKFTLFLHEYIHLIQNLFTIAGWESYSNEMLNYTALTMLTLRTKEIPYPFDKLPPGTIPADIKSVFNVADQYDEYVFEEDRTLGSCKDFEFLGKINIKTVVPPGSKLTSLSEKPFATAKFTVDGHECDIKINPLILSESMSYMVENYYGIATLSSPPPYPYQIIGKIFEKTELKDRLELQIVIIHLSMMTSFPDIQFVKIFEYVVSNDLSKCATVKDFCDKLIADKSTRIQELLDFNLSKIDERMLKYTESIAKYELADKYIRWINDMYGAISAQLKIDPLWYLTPVLNRCGADGILGVLNRNFFMFENSQGEISLHKRGEKDDTDAAEALIFNRNIFHFMDYLIKDYIDAASCPMYMNCALPEKDGCCINEPYKHGINGKGDKLCNYGEAAHLFGVNEYPVKNYR